MNRSNIGLVVGIVALACFGCKSTSFIRTEVTGLVDGEGNAFYIRGTNLGHWLNPEGYMFGFGKCSSPHMIDEVIRQLVGPEDAKDFWKRFKDNYITEADIAFVAKTGANTVRLPFHYKLFTYEDYLGANDPEEGFRRMDAVIRWCRKYGLRVVIDMHDCPGGQAGPIGRSRSRTRRAGSPSRLLKDGTRPSPRSPRAIVVRTS